MSRVALPAISLGGAGAFVASVAVMHFLQPEFDPVDVAVSYYMNGRLGWLLGLGLVALGIGSLTLALALRSRLAPGPAGPGFWLFSVWSAGAVIAGMFPPDPYGRWNDPPSISGMTHGVVAMLAFAAFPPAAWLLSRRLSVLPRMDSSARLLERLAQLCTVFVIVFFACLVPVFQNRAPYALGLVERVLIMAFVAWIVAAALSVRRVAPW